MNLAPLLSAHRWAVRVAILLAIVVVASVVPWLVYHQFTHPKVRSEVHPEARVSAELFFQETEGMYCEVFNRDYVRYLAPGEAEQFRQLLWSMIEYDGEPFPAELEGTIQISFSSPGEEDAAYCVTCVDFPRFVMVDIHGVRYKRYRLPNVMRERILELVGSPRR